MARETSAMPVGLRSRVPAKITSSMREPRSVLADCSPSTQEIASAMFDLPQPFGPMMAAMPSPWNFSSVRSQNDLNPRICSFLSLSKSDSLGGRYSPQTRFALAGLRCKSREFRRLTYVNFLLLTPEVPRWSHCWMPPLYARTSPLLLTNSNGKYRDGSSNKTPHIVGPFPAPPLVAHTVQLLRAIYW